VARMANILGKVDDGMRVPSCVANPQMLKIEEFALVSVPNSLTAF
jgi:hypothetical protein